MIGRVARTTASMQVSESIGQKRGKVLENWAFLAFSGLPFDGKCVGKCGSFTYASMSGAADCGSAYFRAVSVPGVATC